MSQGPPNWDKVAMLLERHAHLNQLRVGTVQVYLVVAAAVLALWGGTDIISVPNAFTIPLGLCLIGVGMLVYIYDLRLRARTYAIAMEVARSIPDGASTPSRVKPKRLDEDLAFSMILMLVNSTLMFIGLEFWIDVEAWGSWGSLALAIAFFALQAVVYSWHWPRLAMEFSAWPDAITIPDPGVRKEPPGSDA